MVKLRTNEKAEIAVIGGTGNYDPAIVEDSVELKVHTPYGPPSDHIIVGSVKGIKIAFLARHGRGHTIPPYKINYRANIWALKQLGVKRIIGSNAVGTLQPEFIKPYEFVVCDQIFDRTLRSSQSFYEGGVVGHVEFADPFCPELRKILIETGRKLGLKIHPTPEEEKENKMFTYVCIEGPRFSTRAESLFYKKHDFSVIGMTLIPESILARELEICYANVALITDSDVYGLMPVTAERVAKSMKENVENFRKLIFAAIDKIPRERNCPCKDILTRALY